MNPITVVDDDLYLSQIVEEYDKFKAYFEERTKDPNNFMSILEFEAHLQECMDNISENIRNASSEWIRDAGNQHSRAGSRKSEC